MPFPLSLCGSRCREIVEPSWVLKRAYVPSRLPEVHSADQAAQHLAATRLRQLRHRSNLPGYQGRSQNVTDLLGETYGRRL